MKLFGGIDLTWPKLILSAVVAGAYTAVMATVPALRYTSFHTVAVSFEVWILLGIIIIMNSRSNLDSALKCFVFFLISQPLVYLLQVPFSVQGWGLFGYYSYWFIWTVLCFPMGYIGYYMKKGKWWGYLILLPMILLTACSYSTYFRRFLFAMPRYLLISLFCACAMILYPPAIFENRKIRAVGAGVGIAAVIVLTVLGLRSPYVYSTDLLISSKECRLDASCTAYLEDSRYGDTRILYSKELEDYLLHADFKKSGDTTLRVVSPDGGEARYRIHIEEDTYHLTKIER